MLTLCPYAMLDAQVLAQLSKILSTKSLMEPLPMGHAQDPHSIRTTTTWKLASYKRKHYRLSSVFQVMLLNSMHGPHTPKAKQTQRPEDPMAPGLAVPRELLAVTLEFQKCILSDACEFSHLFDWPWPR